MEGRPSRGTRQARLASPADTADKLDPSAFWGVILHSQRGLSLRSRHRGFQTSEQRQEQPSHHRHELGPSSPRSRKTTGTCHGMAARPLGQRWPGSRPGEPCCVLSAFPQSAGDPKQGRQAPLHFPFLPVFLHCNYYRPRQTDKWHGGEGAAGRCWPRCL